MNWYLRLLGTLLLVGGLAMAVVATRWVLGDDGYFRAARGLERHPDHILYQAEYQAALARHVGYAATAVVSGLTAVIGSAVLFGLASILGRLDRRAG